MRRVPEGVAYHGTRKELEDALRLALAAMIQVQEENRSLKKRLVLAEAVAFQMFPGVNRRAQAPALAKAAKHRALILKVVAAYDEVEARAAVTKQETAVPEILGISPKAYRVLVKEAVAEGLLEKRAPVRRVRGRS